MAIIVYKVNLIIHFIFEWRNIAERNIRSDVRSILPGLKVDGELHKFSKEIKSLNV